MKSTAQRPSLPKEVEELRTSLDSRLTALEKALADPKQHSLLESLILDLARVATEEATATTRQAVIDAQAAAQKVAEAARADALTALEEEKAQAAALRRVVEEAKTALKQAEAALREERRASEAAAREAAGANREMAVLRASLEQEQAARAAERRELDAALAAAEAERTRTSTLEQQVAQARAEGESERAALASEIEEQRAAIEAARAAGLQLIQARARLEEQVAAADAGTKTLRTELEAARRDAEKARTVLEAAGRELESARGERDAAQRNLDAALRELDGVRQDSDARSRSLSHSQAEQEQVLKAAQDAARSAEARLEEAIRERDEAKNDAVMLQQQLQFAEGAIRERDALKRELQAAHEARDAAEVLDAARNTVPEAELDIDSETVIDLTSVTKEEERQLAIENRIRGLELALRDAETRAESAELELDQLRRSPARPAFAGAPTEPIAPSEPAQEQFRGPARAAKRVQFKGETDIQIDGTPGKLVDLSLTGAQVLTPSAMKPNRLVKVTLPMGDSAVACKAKVMWSRLEPRSGQLWYRAGVSFTSADQLSLEAFLSAHQK